MPGWLRRGEMIVIMAGRLSGLGLSSSVTLYQIGGELEDSIHSSTVSDQHEAAEVVVTGSTAA